MTGRFSGELVQKNSSRLCWREQRRRRRAARRKVSACAPISARDNLDADRHNLDADRHNLDADRIGFLSFARRG